MPAATAIVLAAGQGKRLKSRLPKVLHPVAGRPLIAHVMAALQPLALERVVVVGSPAREEIEAVAQAALVGQVVDYVVQDPPRGTGDAVRLALEAVGAGDGPLLVVPGDAPALTAETLRALLEVHAERGASATLLTARIAEPSGYGRIVRGAGGDVVRIVEEADASPEEKAIDEVNASVYVFDSARLTEVIGKVDLENNQAEYYLTDAIELLRADGDAVVAQTTSESEIRGVNTRADLAEAARILRRRTCDRLLDEGVTIIDPETTYVDAGVTIEADALIHPFTYLEGSCYIAEGAEIGPHTRLVDTEVGPGASVTFTVARSSYIGPEASVGPYASLRAGTRLERGGRIGTFVETKNSTIGEGSKANHLAYLGDAQIGRGVNVGAGTITCNWDGREKHQTVIDDDAYISSDTMLVAPVRIGRGAATGAGSVVREDVPPGALAVGVPARIIEGKGDRLEPQGHEGTIEDDDEPSVVVDP